MKANNHTDQQRPLQKRITFSERQEPSPLVIRLKLFFFNCGILSYVKQIASPGSMHETGCSGLVHWDDPEGWAGEGRGREVQDGEHMYIHG